MGRQYAEQLTDASVLDYFIRFPKSYIDRHIPPGVMNRFGRFGFSFIAGRMAKRINRDEKAFWKAFAKESGLAYADLARTIAMPDAYLYLLSRLSNMRLLAAGAFGCASFMARHDLSKNGGVVHGRNLDFFGGRHWMSGHEIQVRKPKDGLASVTISAAGINAPGLTSINEAGLTLAVHMLFAAKVGMRREPVLSAAARAVKSCRTVAELRRFVSKVRVPAGWAFVASDAKGEASIFEMHAHDTRELVARNELIAATNCYRSDLSMDEAIPVVGLSHGNRARLNRLEEIVVDHEPFDALSGMEAMADTYEVILKRQTAAGHTVANNFTVSSACFDFSGDAVAVTSGQTPAPRGAVTVYRLSALFEGKEEIMATRDGLDDMDDAVIARRHFIEAGWGWNDADDIETVANAIGLAFDTDPNEPAYALFLAVMRLRQFRSEEAAALAARAAEQYPDSYRTGLCLLVEAIAHDRAGRRGDALVKYDGVITMHPFDDLVRFARRCRKRPATPDDIGRLEPNWFTSLVLPL